MRPRMLRHSQRKSLRGNAGKHVRGLPAAARRRSVSAMRKAVDSNFAANSPAMRRRDRADGGAKCVIAHLYRHRVAPERRAGMRWVGPIFGVDWAQLTLTTSHRRAPPSEERTPVDESLAPPASQSGKRQAYGSIF